MRIQRAVDRQPQPWRNGRGVQYEIIANGPLPEGWTWKLSTADITEDVPFSVFPDVSRQFCVADGNGTELTIDGVRHLCPPRSITPFEGDAVVHARLLDGPMRALNLMTRGGDTSWLRVVMPGQSVTDGMAVTAICGSAEIEVDGTSVSLLNLDSVIELTGATIDVKSGTLAVLGRAS